MIINRSCRVYLAMVGVFPDQSLANLKFFLTALVGSTSVVANFVSLLHEANTFLEYANSIFITSTVSMVAVCFVITCVARSRLFALIDSSNDLVNEREYRSDNPIFICK